MKTDDEILADFNKRSMQHIQSVKALWRDIEVRRSYSMYEGLQYSAEQAASMEADGIKPITINKEAPIIDAISGFEIQNRTEAQYIPRLPKETSEGFTDIVQNTNKYIEQEAQADNERSQAFKDMLKCGVGAVNTTISYDQNPDGEVQKTRYFPWLLMWDVAARRKNLVDRNWNAIAKVVDIETLAEEVNNALRLKSDEAGGGEDTYRPYNPAGLSMSIDSEFLYLYQDNARGGVQLGVIYEYEWREKEPFYRVQNPFRLFADPNDPTNQPIMAWIEQDEKKYNINIDDSVFNMEPATYRAFKKECDKFGIILKAEVQKKYKYYRAIIGGGYVLSKGENFSQTGFALQFMTGKFSEIDQIFYGILRAMNDAQVSLNTIFSDYVTYLRTTPKGGVNIESDAVEDIEGFIATYSKARDVTVFKPGALSNGKVMPKQPPAAGTAMVEAITTFDQYLYTVAGIDQSFMGMTESKDMTGVLYAQKIRQTLTTLAEFFDAKKFFIANEAKLNIDCIRILAENNPGRLIRDVTGASTAPYFPLLADGIAAEYDVVINEVPQTPSERQETFAKLLEMAGLLAQKGVDILPLAVKFAPLSGEEKQEVEKAMQPPPPPQPDPINQGLLVAETNYKNAMAQKASVEASVKQKEIEQADDKMAAQVQQLVSQAILNYSKASEVPSNIMAKDVSAYNALRGSILP